MTPYLVRLFKRYLQHSTRPILVGPWHSELGFEVLYWEPFLLWLLDKIPAERITAITRGGVPIYPNHVELYNFLSPKELRAHTFTAGGEQKSIKQYRVHQWERRLVERVTDHLGLKRRPILVHPSWMYRLFDPVWKERVGLKRVFEYAKYPFLKKPPKMQGLPDKYYTVKFYGRATFPLTPDHRRLAETVVTGLLNRAPVLCLSTPTQYDDHLDMPISRREGVLFLSDVKDEGNLAVQLSAIAHSGGFVGPYGGLQQAALRYGVPSLGFYQDWQGTMMAHRSLSEYIASQRRTPFTVARSNEMAVWSPVMDQLSSRVGRVHAPEPTINSA